MGLSHVMLRVKDIEKSKAFYTTTLAPLGYTIAMELPGMVAFKNPSTGHYDFWIQATAEGKAAEAIHLAFLGDNEEKVKEFHDAAMKAGAKDNGAPGPRPHYSDKYYGGFVIDLDGHNIECVHFIGE